jgi:hypothetical protein
VEFCITFLQRCKFLKSAEIKNFPVKTKSEKRIDLNDGRQWRQSVLKSGGLTFPLPFLSLPNPNPLQNLGVTTPNPQDWRLWRQMSSRCVQDSDRLWTTHSSKLKYICSIYAIVLHSVSLNFELSPTEGFRFKLFDPSRHDVSSNEYSFQLSGRTNVAKS